MEVRSATTLVQRWSQILQLRMIRTVSPGRQPIVFSLCIAKGSQNFKLCRSISTTAPHLYGPGYHCDLRNTTHQTLIACQNSLRNTQISLPAPLSVGSARGMAGHSKWANIRHIKAAKDSQKSRTTTEFTRRLRAFVRETGQTDPKTSSYLAKMISEAKGKNIPSVTVDKALAQLVVLKNSPPLLFEAKGPGGSIMLVEAVSTKITHTRGEIQSIVKKAGFSVFDGGSLARMVFDEKGMVTVHTEEEKPDLDKYTDVAIEAGAEDVQLEEDEEYGHVLQFLCGPKDLYKVKKALETKELPVRSAEVIFIANTHVPMDDASLELVGKVLDKLDEHPDVLKVYTNVVEKAS